MTLPARPEMWFLAYAALVYAGILGALLGRSAPRAGKGTTGAPTALLVRVALLCWLSGVLFLAKDAFFLSSTTPVSPLVPLVAAEVALIAFLAVASGPGRWVRVASPYLLTGLQAFRTPLGAFPTLGNMGEGEGLATSALAALSIFPGAACAIAAGLAILWSRRSLRARARAEGLLVAVNVAGLVAWMAMAWSLGNETATWLSFPWILLPAFHLPLGLALHTLALRGLAARFATRRELAAAREIDGDARGAHARGPGR